MKKHRVYLDNCCFNRPYDNQNNLIVHLETESKLFIQDLILKGVLELAWSFIMDYENNDNPFEERKNNIALWKPMAIIDCDLCDEIAAKAADFMKLGLRQKDASHISCAIYAKANFFLTTDKKILNKPISEINILNPIDFVRRYYCE
jgi:predicted nucleic acid-binding protein